MSPLGETVPTRKLTAEELEEAVALLEELRRSLTKLSGSDPELLFAYRRYLAKKLSYDERSSPAKRRALKRRKLIAQEGKCADRGEMLPPAGLGSVLDRIDPMLGYTFENTRLLCRECDTRIQRERAFSG
jgi:hypothetical protein